MQETIHCLVHWFQLPLSHFLSLSHTLSLFLPLSLPLALSTPPSPPHQAPHCLQEATLDQAVTEALSSPLKDVVSNAELSRTQLETLTHLGGLVHQGKDLYDEIKEVHQGASGLICRNLCYRVKL